MGRSVGDWVGRSVGEFDGLAVGELVGFAVGDNVGLSVGAEVGNAIRFPKQSSICNDTVTSPSKAIECQYLVPTGETCVPPFITQSSYFASTKYNAKNGADKSSNTKYPLNSPSSPTYPIIAFDSFIHKSSSPKVDIIYVPIYTSKTGTPSDISPESIMHILTNVSLQDVALLLLLLPM